MPATSPLAALDPAGAGTSISYNVPEPISYSGRNYIHLPFPSSAFRGITATVEPQVPAAGWHDTLAVGRVSAPTGVVLNGIDAAPDAPLVAFSPKPLTDRLAGMTVGATRALLDSGQSLLLGSAPITDRLDGLVAARIAGRGIQEKDPTEIDGRNGRDLAFYISAPAPASPRSDSTYSGSSSAAIVPVSGKVEYGGLNGSPTTYVSVDGASATVIGQGGSYNANLEISSAGRHTITIAAVGHAVNPVTKQEMILRRTVDVSFNVTLNGSDNNAPRQPPVVVVDAPRSGTTLVVEKGTTRGVLTIGGSVQSAAGSAVTSVVVVVDGQTIEAGVSNDQQWKADVMLSGLGNHDITVSCVDSTETSSAVVTTTVVVADDQPHVRMTTQILLAERLSLSSFLGRYGAGRVIKTFSLLPGEETTITVTSFRQREDEIKSSSSIVDSNASDAEESFQSALAEETSTGNQDSSSFNYKIGLTAGASFGFGSASVNTELSGSANSARQEAAKNALNATRSHSLKASTNRNVTVTTEQTMQSLDRNEQTSTRQIRNINVSRALNFVFRQMNQEHITLVHLVDVKAAYYTEDLMLDVDGNPLYTKDAQGNPVPDIRRVYKEAPLFALDQLLADVVQSDRVDEVKAAIMGALTTIPDFRGTLNDVVERVIPKDRDGNTVEGAAYLRFRADLKTEYVDAQTLSSFSVPGIVLGSTSIVMRTDGILVDSILGPGNALDPYSQGLQEVTVDDRRVAIAGLQEDIARKALARSIVESSDATKAALFSSLFPVVAPVPAISVSTSRNQTGDGSSNG